MTKNLFLRLIIELTPKKNVHNLNTSRRIIFQVISLR
eukprot:UN21806